MTVTTSNTGRCRMCKWWGVAPRFDTSRQWGLCKYAAGHDKLIWSASDIMVHADFGCVQWERKHEEADAVKEQGGSA